MARNKHNAIHQYAVGLNNATNTGPSDLPFPTPGLQGWKWIVENFTSGHTYVADAEPWEFTAETSGTVTVGINGPIITTNGSDNSSALLQHLTPQILLGANTKKLYIETTVNLTAATMASNEIFVGITSDQSGTAFVAAAGTSWAFDDGFGFGKLDTATELDFITTQSSVEQAVGFGSTLTTATITRLAAYYDGTSYFLYKDGELVANANRSVFNDDAVMGVSIYCKAGTGAAQTLAVNYVAIGVEL